MRERQFDKTLRVNACYQNHYYTSWMCEYVPIRSADVGGQKLDASWDGKQKEKRLGISVSPATQTSIGRQKSCHHPPQ